MYLDLDIVKLHCRIESDYTDEDEYILELQNIAEHAVAKALGYDYDDTDLPDNPGFKILTLLTVANLYANREPVAYSSVNKVLYTYDSMLNLYKNYSVNDF